MHGQRHLQELDITRDMKHNRSEMPELQEALPSEVGAVAKHVFAALPATEERQHEWSPRTCMDFPVEWCR